MKSLVNLLVLVAFGAAAWYGYSNFVGLPSGDDEAADAQGFNCRSALSRLAQDYKCRDTADCSFSSEDEAALKRLETDIERYCN